MSSTTVIEDVIVAPSGRKIGFLARGPISGRVVLHLHGAPGSRREQLLVFPDAVLDRFGIRAVSVDRPGYGNTDPLPGSRVERVQDVLEVADALGIDRFALVGVSCGGSNVLTLAAVVPRRVDRVVLLCGQMPYDDEDAIVTLQPAQLAGLPFLRQGRSQLIERMCEQTRTAHLVDPVAAFAEGTATLSAREKAWYAQPWVRDAFVADMQEAFRASAEGIIDDGLTMVRPFEVDVSTVSCPVRAVHGSADDWEPLPNLRRVLDQLNDVQLFVLEGLNHFGSIMYPDLVAMLCTEQTS